jgi:spore maturation protein CgeB
VRFALFCHSLISDWNHGNAHFLRGVVRELLARGNDVRVFEPRDAWSARNLVRDHGEAAIAAFRAAYPGLDSHRYGPELDLDEALDGVDVAIVHEWSDPALVRRIGVHRVRAPRGYVLLFHDTHHRSATAPDEMARYDLSGYDGVLACGAVISELYRELGWAARAWTWHEAADTRTFFPQPALGRDADLVWIGNWGDDERAHELRELLVEPVRELGLRARVHGARYPESARAELAAAGIAYSGWLPNFLVPAVYARHAVTVHVPRRAYATALPGIPTIRVFEALACGIPLVTGPWRDCEGLFSPGDDFLVARDRREMRGQLRAIVHDRDFALALAARGRTTVAARHTCAHRVDELERIVKGLA